MNANEFSLEAAWTSLMQKVLFNLDESQLGIAKGIFYSGSYAHLLSVLDILENEPSDAGRIQLLSMQKDEMESILNGVTGRKAVAKHEH